MEVGEAQTFTEPDVHECKHFYFESRGLGIKVSGKWMPTAMPSLAYFLPLASILLFYYYPSFCHYSYEHFESSYYFIYLSNMDFGKPQGNPMTAVLQ